MLSKIAIKHFEFLCRIFSLRSNTYYFLKILISYPILEKYFHKSKINSLG